MRKLALFLCGIFISTNTFAYQEIIGSDFIVKSKNLNDVHVVGKEVVQESDVDEDLMMLAGETIINGNIGVDLIVVGGDIDVSGNVGDDLRVFGGEVALTGNVEDDILGGAGSFEIKDTALIKGDVVIGTGDLDYAGMVLGNAKFIAEKVHFRGTVDKNVVIHSKKVSFHPDSQIRGDLLIKGPVELPDYTENVVKGRIKHVPIVSAGSICGDIFGPIFYKLLFLIIFGSLFYFWMEGFWRQAAGEMVERKGVSFLKGLGYFLLFPLLIILLFVSMIGLPLGLFGIFLYIFSFVLYELIIVVVFTGWLVNKFFGKYVLNSALKKFGIIVVIAFLVTAVNGLDFILAIFAVGALITLKQQILKETLSKKVIVQVDTNPKGETPKC